MDVGHPSNFERMLWLYGSDLDAMRRDVAGCRFSDDDVRATIRRVYEERGYLLDPHSAIAYMGLVGREGQDGQDGRDGKIGIFLSTAHPAKFAEIVEPIIGRAGREAGGARRGAQRSAAHHPDSRLARSRARDARWLSASGIAPTCSSSCWCTAFARPSDTSPELVRDFVRDLYKYEIRCLRERYLQREFPKIEYAGRVDELRRRYPVLALQPREFLET